MEIKRPDEFADAFESAFAELRADVERACADANARPAAVAAAIQAAFSFAAAEPAAVRTLTIDAITGGELSFRHYDQMIEHFAGALRPMRGDVSADRWLPEITEKALVGGVASMIAKDLYTDRQAELDGLITEAIQFVLTPYLGGGEARRVAVRRET